MAVEWIWAGGTSDSGFHVRASIDAGASVRLAVTTTGNFTDAVYYGPVAPSSEGVVALEATGLDASAVCSYALEVDGELDEVIGQITTYPPVGQPADVTVAAASCAGSSPDFPGVLGDELAPNRVSNHPVFDQIRSRGVLEFLHMGDATYYDPGSGVHVPDASLSTYRTAYRDFLAQPRQAALYRSLGVRYCWDDHDFGPNDSDSTAPGRDNACQVYRENVPHGPLGAGGGANPIYQAWQVGRVQWVMWDSRADRDPNSDPQGPAKSMLGSAQRAWFSNLLATSTAEALVIVSPSVWWEPGRADGWASFQDEQAWVIDRIAEHGWTGRVVIISGDVHALAIDTGTNSPGGIPVFQFASLDSAFGSVQHHYDTGPSRPGRGQYGTLRCRDTGDQIEITGSCWTGDTVWRSHTHTITLSAPPPEPPPEPPPAVAVGAIRETVHWLGVDDRTGRVIADLPDTTGETSRLLMAYTSNRLTLPLTQSGPGGLPIRVVEQATQPQGCSIVQVVNDLPVWAGRVLVRSGGSDGPLTLGVVSSEQYLLQRRVTARSYIGQDRALVGADLLTDAGSTDLGPGMGLEIDVEACGDTVDREYLPSDLVTVYQALRELAEAGTLEWTIDYDWTDHTATVLRRIARLRRRIGRVGGIRPVFETEAGVTYTLTEDFSTGRYANAVTVYGDGEGVDLPRASAQTGTGGVPVVEYAMHVRDVTDPDELNAIATAELARLMHGVELWDLDCPLNAEPRLGLNAGLGDTAAWRLTSARHPSPDGIAAGAVGDGRIIGWALDVEDARWKPQLLDPHETTAL